MPQLRDIRIVDLKHSIWDKEKSEPKKGKYIFKKKVKINYFDKGKRPEWWFYLCRYDSRNNYRELSEMRYTLDATPVTLGEDEYWPEGLVPNAEGHYVFGDLILVKYPLITYLKNRQRAQELSMRARGTKTTHPKLQQFKADVRKQSLADGKGFDASEVPDEWINSVMGFNPTETEKKSPRLGK
jgi:hypothetical protein